MRLKSPGNCEKGFMLISLLITRHGIFGYVVVRHVFFSSRIAPKYFVSLKILRRGNAKHLQLKLPNYNVVKIWSLILLLLQRIKTANHVHGKNDHFCCCDLWCSVTIYLPINKITLNPFRKRIIFCLTLFLPLSLLIMFFNRNFFYGECSLSV